MKLRIEFHDGSSVVTSVKWQEILKAKGFQEVEEMKVRSWSLDREIGE